MSAASLLRQLTHRIRLLEAVRLAAERCVAHDSDAAYDELTLRLEQARGTVVVPENGWLVPSDAPGFGLEVSESAIVPFFT